MKLAWVTPLSAKSAIARVTIPVAQELRERGYEVLLIKSDADPTVEEIDHKMSVLSWRSADPFKIDRDFDCLLVNVGDNYLLHAGIFPFLDYHPLGIFHDYFLYNLFRGWIATVENAEAEHHRILSSLYVDASVESISECWKGLMSLEQIASRFPMTEWIAGRCGATLAHADFYAERLRSACSGPVASARMGVVPRSPKNVTRNRPATELRIVTLGVQNRNKCADLVIEALSNVDRTRCPFQYRLVGPISDEDRDRLTLAAARHQVPLSITGSVDDIQFDEELEAADLICCLRKPVLEGSSASAIEGLMAGKPMIVADAGFYSELPSDILVKVPRDVPVPELARALVTLMNDIPLRNRLNLTSQDWARRNFSIFTYTDELESLIKHAINVRPYSRIARSVGDQLTGLGVHNHNLVSRIAATMEGLFGL